MYALLYIDATLFCVKDAHRYDYVVCFICMPRSIQALAWSQAHRCDVEHSDTLQELSQHDIEECTGMVKCGERDVDKV